MFGRKMLFQILNRKPNVPIICVFPRRGRLEHRRGWSSVRVLMREVEKQYK